MVPRERGRPSILLQCMSQVLLLGAEWQYDRLPALAAELVRRGVAVICALWNVPALAAKSVETLPVVFAVGGDPVQLGLVARLDRPAPTSRALIFFLRR
jgi:hypothetical protein